MTPMSRTRRRNCQFGLTRRFDAVLQSPCRKDRRRKAGLNAKNLCVLAFRILHDSHAAFKMLSRLGLPHFDFQKAHLPQGRCAFSFAIWRCNLAAGASAESGRNAPVCADNFIRKRTGHCTASGSFQFLFFVLSRNPKFSLRSAAASAAYR